MNRIVLIGNGFDLAHGMRTSYQNFLDHFWNEQMNAVKKHHNTDRPIQSFNNKHITVLGIKQFGIFVDEDPDLIGFKAFERYIDANKFELKFENKFIEIISKKSNFQNWVDIEQEYYDLLIKIITSKSKLAYSINKLNSDFNEIKLLLKDYLTNTENDFQVNFKDPRIKNSIGSKIYSPVKHEDLTEHGVNLRVEIVFEKMKNEITRLRSKVITNEEINSENSKIIKRLNINQSDIEIKKSLRKLLLSDIAGNYFDLSPENILFLNFNYTSNDLYYKESNDFSNFDSQKKMNSNVLRIHGSLFEPDNNPIIFGYGDEIDENYKMIENLNQNGYLENIKSIKYLETDNYKKLLEFVNSNEYQIFLFGHSCGISDRTLLNTVFEHENCVSIKPFYYQIDHNHDNYSDLVRNISRNFNDKVLMISKVVNKTYCEPLT